MPWKMTTLKYASRSSIRSAAIDATSRNTGEGCESKENDIRLDNCNGVGDSLTVE
jgi:hypothetical protein